MNTTIAPSGRPSGNPTIGDSASLEEALDQLFTAFGSWREVEVAAWDQRERHGRTTSKGEFWSRVAVAAAGRAVPAWWETGDRPVREHERMVGLPTSDLPAYVPLPPDPEELAAEEAYAISLRETDEDRMQWLAGRIAAGDAIVLSAGRVQWTGANATHVAEIPVYGDDPHRVALRHTLDSAMRMQPE